MPVYQTLLNSVSHIVKHYRADLEIHDRHSIESNPGVPFLHFTNDCGTHILMLYPHDHDRWPRPGEWTKYLFSTANREMMLEDGASFTSCACQSHPLIHHFDGKTLRRISDKQAVNVAKDHRDSVLAAWERPVVMAS